MSNADEKTLPDSAVTQTKSSELLDCKPSNPADDGAKLRQLLGGMSRPPTFRMDASSVLDRVKAFLPEMEKANTNLEQEMKTRPASDFDIETLTEGVDNHVEMNIFAGVFENKTEADKDGEDASGNVAHEALASLVMPKDVEGKDSQEQPSRKKRGIEEL
eukprot:m.259254 g.259254  ORF g.259254 m.259254 type:complete len:160 (-) comp37797_c0_seq1:272-751(-)